MVTETLVTLPANKTYAYRHASWVPVSVEGKLIGVLVITESISYGSKRHTSRYALLEDGAEVLGRRFKLSKPRGKRPSPYYVFISPWQGQSLCECPGFESGGDCKHIQSLTLLITGGLIPTLSVRNIKGVKNVGKPPRGRRRPNHV